MALRSILTVDKNAIVQHALQDATPKNTYVIAACLRAILEHQEWNANSLLFQITEYALHHARTGEGTVFPLFPLVTQAWRSSNERLDDYLASSYPKWLVSWTEKNASFSLDQCPHSDIPIVIALSIFTKKTDLKDHIDHALLQRQEARTTALVTMMPLIQNESEKPTVASLSAMYKMIYNAYHQPYSTPSNIPLSWSLS